MSLYKKFLKKPQHLFSQLIVKYTYLVLEFPVCLKKIVEMDACNDNDKSLSPSKN